MGGRGRGTGGLGRSDPAQSQRAGGTRALLLDSLHLQTRVQQASVKFLNEVKPGAGIFLVPWEHHTVLPGIQLPNKAGPWWVPGASPRLELWAVKVRRHADNSSLQPSFTGLPLGFAQRHRKAPSASDLSGLRALGI